MDTLHRSNNNTNDSINLEDNEITTLRHESFSMLYTWFLNPSRFFKQITNFFKNRTRKQKIGLVAISYLFPISFGLILFSIWMQFAISTILERFVPNVGVMGIFVVASFGISGLLLLSQPVSDIQGETPLPLLKRITAYYKAKYSKLSIFRTHLYFIPINLAFAIFSLADIGGPWNVYELSTYFGILLLFVPCWTIYFILSSLSVLGEKLNLKKIISKILLSVVLVLVIYLTLDSVFQIWLGASDAPFWAKVAMVFLHGQ